MPAGTRLSAKESNALLLRVRDLAARALESTRPGGRPLAHGDLEALLAAWRELDGTLSQPGSAIPDGWGM